MALNNLRTLEVEEKELDAGLLFEFLEPLHPRTKIKIKRLAGHPLDPQMIKLEAEIDIFTEGPSHG